MESSRNWRVGHTGRDQMYYEERHEGTWHRLTIDGEMLVGPAHHVIYFASPATWRGYPVWARDRRAEIVARIKSEFREPEYEYLGDAPSAPPDTDGDGAPAGAMTDQAQQASAQHPPPPARTSSPPPPDASTPEQRRALLLAIILVFASAIGAGWAVLDGVMSGAARWPVRPTMQRVVDRASEPAMFHTALGVYAAIGIVSLSLGVWGLRQWLSLRVGRRSSNR